MTDTSMFRQTIIILRAFLAARSLPWVLALLAFVIMVGTLDEGFLVDDYVHRSKLLGRSYEGSGDFLNALNDMYAINRTESQISEFKQVGLMPWWTSPELRFSNWRPLTALTHWIDYQLFPHLPAAMHVHNLIWFALAVLAVTLLYRGVSGSTWAAGLAGLMYLLDEANYMPALWIANRNELIAVTFGAIAIICHHQWCKQGSRKHAAGSVMFLLMSLLATEAGIATFGYVIAYALCLDHDPWPKRLTRVIPGLTLIVLWRMIYNGLNHGVMECGAIIDPGRTPMVFARAVLERGPVLLMGQLGLAQPDLYGMSSSGLQLRLWIACVVGAVAVGLLLIPLLHSSLQARFYGLGMVLAAVPICATMPSSRNLMFVAIGGFGLIAQFLATLIQRADCLYRLRPLKIAAWTMVSVFLVLHVPVAALSRIPQPQMARMMTTYLVPHIPMDSIPTPLEEKDIVIINSPNPFCLFYTSLVREHQNKPLPRSIRALSPSFGALEVERPSANTLVIRAKRQSLFAYESTSHFGEIHLYRKINKICYANWDHLHPGHTQRLSNVSIQVNQVDKTGAPKEVTFSFDVSLEDASLVWVAYDHNNSRYRPFKIPEVGEKHEFTGPRKLSLHDTLKNLRHQLF